MNAEQRIAALEHELEETYRSVTHLTNELMLTMERLKSLSLQDDLTKLPNRVLYHDRLETACALAERESQRFAIALMDLNRFKEINDSIGHEAGDRVLQEVAQRVRARLRRSDTVARIGGDEFAFLLPVGAGEDGTVALAEAIVQAVQNPIEIDGRLVDVGASIGLVFCPDHGKDLRLLMRLADRMMYEAKRTGGGYRIFDGRRGRQESSRQVLFAADLKAAIADDQLDLHYQPKVRLKDGRVMGFEALVRWQHPTQGLIMPDAFIPLAERTPLIVPFTLKTITLAVDQLLAWRTSSLAAPIAVNLSPSTLRDRALPHEILDLLEMWQLPSDFLMFEVTETAFMTDPETAIRILTRIGSLGVRISIDDFGTGFSSLSYLSKLPAQEIKIDRSFVSRMHLHKEDFAIVRSVIDLARNLDITVVAEGVESERDWRLLAELGCDSAQGYYIARPTAAADLSALSGRWALPPANKASVAARSGRS